MITYTFDELFLDKDEPIRHAAWLLQKGHAKSPEYAIQTVYSERAVEKAILEHQENENIRFMLGESIITGPREEHPWEHDIKTDEEQIDVKSFDADDPDKNCFSISFDYKNARESELPSKYVGVLISYKNKTATVAYWQHGYVVREFAEENFDEYLNNNMAGYEGYHKYCLVPIEEFFEI